jgi:hypothetical protein
MNDGRKNSKQSERARKERAARRIAGEAYQLSRQGTPNFGCMGGKTLGAKAVKDIGQVLRTVIVEQKSARTGRTKTVTRSVQCELTQSMVKRQERPRTDRAESLFKTNISTPVPAKET